MIYRRLGFFRSIGPFLLVEFQGVNISSSDDTFSAADLFSARAMDRLGATYYALSQLNKAIFPFYPTRRGLPIVTDIGGNRLLMFFTMAGHLNYLMVNLYPW